MNKLPLRKESQDVLRKFVTYCRVNLDRGKGYMNADFQRFADISNEQMEELMNELDFKILNPSHARSVPETATNKEQTKD